ncbi:MAG: hypothetical protein RQ745_08845 [Longimicrobiales bacterium]|nr:hypothetical protein [Longimicrobiales bacterium]
MFDRIVGMTWLKGDRLAVADAGYQNIRIFEVPGQKDPDLVLGRPGQGPGEFVSIGGIWTLPGDTLAVWDPGTRRVTVFTQSGELVHSLVVEFDESAANLEVFHGSFDDGDAILGALSFGEDRAGVVPDRWEVLRVGVSDASVHPLFTLAGMRRLDRRPIPFSMMPLVAPSGDRIVTADAPGGEIRVRTGDGNSIETWSIPRPQTKLARDLQSQLLRRLESEGRQIYRDYIRAGVMPIEGPVPEMSAILADDSGRFWVKRWGGVDDSIWFRENALHPSPGGEWVVLDRDGRFLASVAMPVDFRPLVIQRDRVAGVAVDALGVQTVAVHRLLVSGSRPRP